MCVVNVAQVPRREFKVLLRYLEGLQGRQRQLCLERAQRTVEGYGRDEEPEDHGVGTEDERVEPGEDLTDQARG